MKQIRLVIDYFLLSKSFFKKCVVKLPNVGNYFQSFDLSEIVMPTIVETAFFGCVMHYYDLLSELF